MFWPWGETEKEGGECEVGCWDDEPEPVEVEGHWVCLIDFKNHY